MIVVDASVIIKMLQAEEGSGRALKLRDLHVADEEEIVVPPLLFYEVANALRFNKKLSEVEIEDLLLQLSGLSFRVIEQELGDFIAAVRVARAYSVTVYDAVYVVLAQAIGCNFVTSDRKFATAVDLPFVKVL